MGYNKAMVHKLALQSVRIKNFKAIQDSGVVKFTPLTVFIGNNGSGKSSLIEGLETLREITLSGLGQAFAPWRGFENVWNKAAERKQQRAKDGRAYLAPAMRFELRGGEWRGLEAKEWVSYQGFTEIGMESGTNRLSFLDEMLQDKTPITRTVRRIGLTQIEVIHGREGTPLLDRLGAERSLLSATNLATWQFVKLNPDVIGSPYRLPEVYGTVQLNPDGSNIGEYLTDLLDQDRRQNTQEFQGLLKALQFVLSYAGDLQPTITSELERSVYLQLSEQNFKVPGWLLSTGTLRIVCLLALLRHPTPPPILFIEEIENGLDPRTIHLIVEEIRDAVQRRGIQVVLTTHSPYLLDLLPLSSLVLCERNQEGEPQFYCPTNDESLQRWAQDFAPGQLYTMGRLRRKP